MAVDFTAASSQYLDCGSNASLDNIQTAITLAAWVYPDDISAAYHAFLTKYGAAGPGWMLEWNPGNLYYFCSRATTYGLWHSTTSLNTTSWQHIVCTYNGSSTANDPIFYINGISAGCTEDSTPSGALSDDSANKVNICRREDIGMHVDGRTEDVRIFNRILTPSEAAILAAGYRGPLGGEVMWLPMDGARATPVFDGATLAVNTNYLNDVSGNGNHGNPTGNPLGKASTCPRSNLWRPRPLSSGYMAAAVHNWLRQHGRQSYYKWS